MLICLRFDPKTCKKKGTWSISSHPRLTSRLVNNVLSGVDKISHPIQWMVINPVNCNIVNYQTPRAPRAQFQARIMSRLGLLLGIQRFPFIANTNTSTNKLLCVYIDMFLYWYVCILWSTQEQTKNFALKNDLKSGGIASKSLSEVCTLSNCSFFLNWVF